MGSNNEHDIIEADYVVLGDERFPVKPIASQMPTNLPKSQSQHQSIQKPRPPDIGSLPTWQDGDEATGLDE